MSNPQATLNKVAWSKTALGQLKIIRAYIGQFNPMSAQSLAQGLVATGNSLADFPHRGRIVTGTDRRELVAVYPYIIRYIALSATKSGYCA